jgi:hypothetical protein
VAACAVRGRAGRPGGVRQATGVARPHEQEAPGGIATGLASRGTSPGAGRGIGVETELPFLPETGMERRLCGDEASFFTGDRDGAEILRRRSFLLYLRVEVGRAKERAVFFARPVNDSLMNFLVVEIILPSHIKS